MRSTQVESHINAPPSVVYRLLLNPAAVARWRVPDGMRAEVHTFDAREGGDIHISLTYDALDAAGKTVANTDTYRGRFVRLVPDKEVVEIQWFETDDPAMKGEMRSTITLAESPSGGTSVTGVHDNVPPGVSLEDNETGWKMSFEKLAALAESR